VKCGRKDRWDLLPSCPGNLCIAAMVSVNKLNNVKISTSNFQLAEL